MEMKGPGEEPAERGSVVGGVGGCRHLLLERVLGAGRGRPPAGPGAGLSAQSSDAICFLTLPRSLLCLRRREGETPKSCRGSPGPVAQKGLLALGDERPGVFWKLL